MRKLNVLMRIRNKGFESVRHKETKTKKHEKDPRLK